MEHTEWVELLSATLFCDVADLLVRRLYIVRELEDFLWISIGLPNCALLLISCYCATLADLAKNVVKACLALL